MNSKFKIPFYNTFSKGKQNLKFLSFIPLLFLFFLFSSKASAQNFYVKDGSQYSPTFNLNLEDESGTTFSLQTASSASDPALWTASGVNISKFEFITSLATSSGVETTYEIKLGGKYGNEYSVTGFRFLGGSKLNLIEYDESVFDGDDKIEYNLRNNIITINKLSSDIKSGDTDLDLEEESFLAALNINLQIAIDLKKTGISSTTDSSPTDTKTVQAVITGNKNGFVFKSGLSQTVQGETNQNSSSGDVEVIPAENNEDGMTSGNLSPVRDVPTIGFSKSAKGLTKPQTGQIKGISSERNLEVFIVNITNWLLSFVAAIAVLMLIYGGYLWIMDQGEEQMAEKSKKIIMGSVIGILLIISAYTIVNTIIKLESNATDGCGAGIEIGNGTDINLNCDLSQASNEAIGAGIGGVVGNITGRSIGDAIGDEKGGDTGGLIGGLLGGAVGAITGGGNWGNFFK